MNIDQAEPWSGIFSPVLRVRHEASQSCPDSVRDELVHAIEKRAGLPRPGTSGTANAYLILVGSEFGTSIPSTKPGYHKKDGSDDLWNLRVGLRNPHFDARWDGARKETRLWNRLHGWLVDSLGDTTLAHSQFCWANLSVTGGDDDLGTSESHRDGMERHVGVLALAARSRILAATNDRTNKAVTEWAMARGATLLGVETSDGPLGVLSVPQHGRAPLLVAKLGHPSRGVTRAAFVGRLQALVRLAEETAAGS